MKVFNNEMRKRVSINGSSVTLNPGVNEISNEKLANLLISRGHVSATEGTKNFTKGVVPVLPVTPEKEESTPVTSTPEVTETQVTPTEEVPESTEDGLSKRDLIKIAAEKGIDISEFKKLTKAEMLTKLEM